MNVANSQRCKHSLHVMKSFLLVAYCLVLSYADDDEMFPMEKRGSRKHYCGPELRGTLMLICDGIYKRSGPADSSSVHEDWMMHFMGMDDLGTANNFPFQSRTRAFAMFPGYLRRQTRGVADECCSKACTIAELATYCGPRPKSKS
ncbi:LIRP-like isoform X1 [Homalodisca vitripennis]|uniref:LIRP-like isoform X1 n=2 Tax=Homalodisca vitripennis TaxID=197043 RepID=UPI001EECBFA6|nr:LIRP-like isoform X1 [Homalodisca vitripennis]